MLGKSQPQGNVGQKELEGKQSTGPGKARGLQSRAF